MTTPSLNSEIVAYLTINNISYTAKDYQTGQPAGQPDQILYWNASKLGPQPSQAQLDAAWPVYEGQQIQAQNSSDAQKLLAATDWTCTIDITNPTYSNPYLTNQPDFLAYRSAVRAIGVNPPTTPAVFPAQPTPTWSNT